MTLLKVSLIDIEIGTCASLNVKSLVGYEAFCFCFITIRLEIMNYKVWINNLERFWKWRQILVKRIKCPHDDQFLTCIFYFYNSFQHIFIQLSLIISFTMNEITVKITPLKLKYCFLNRIGSIKFICDFSLTIVPTFHMMNMKTYLTQFLLKPI